MRIYFTGAHSTGKTTLVRYVSQRYGLKMISEVARQVLTELELPLERLRTDIDLVDKYQEQVYYRQLSVENSLEGDFVSDRAFDALAYTAEHARIVGTLIRRPEFHEYVDKLKASVVFFVRPSLQLVTSDGIRETPLWEGIVRIDGMVKMLLEMMDIPYVSISVTSMQERVRLIDYVLQAKGFKPKTNVVTPGEN